MKQLTRLLLFYGENMAVLQRWNDVGAGNAAAISGENHQMGVFVLLFPQVGAKLWGDHFWGAKRENQMQYVNNMPKLRDVSMRALFAAGVLVGTAFPSNAARIDVRTLTCQQAVNLVYSRGAIVLTLTNNTYDRIVRDVLQCMRDEQAENVFAQTRDHPRCRIGKRCVPYDPIFRD